VQCAWESERASERERESRLLEAAAEIVQTHPWAIHTHTHTHIF